MKKVITILIVLFVCSSLFASVLADSVQKGKVSIGASFGTSGSSEKSIHTDDATLAVKSGNVGYVARVRFDVMYSEKQSATIMASFDKPSKTVLVRSDELNEDEFVNPMYVRLFVGASEHSVSSSNLVIAVGVGVEGFYDLNAKVFGVGPASYIRTSYQIPGTHFTFDATAKGDATVVNLFNKAEGRHLYLEGDVSLGFSIYF